jgi:two-component system response regulator HydG
MVESGEFRQDLLFRLQVVTLELPPLRDRPGDLPLLLDHFVSELAEQHGRTITGMTPEARAILSRYPWPGNVRELRNAVENMVLLSRDGLIGMEDLPMGVRGGENQVPSGTLVLAGRSLADVERELIRVNLDLMDGNRAQTAEVLGIGERTLYRKLKEYGL